MEYKIIRHISSRTQNFIDSSHIFTNVKKEHLLPEYMDDFKGAQLVGNFSSSDIFGCESSP